MPGHVEGGGRLADQRELRLEVVGRLRPVGLVVRVHLVAEGMLRLVEDDRDVGRLHAGGGVLQQLPQHVAEAVDGAERQPVRLAGERRQGVVGAIDVGRAVDQEDVVAALDPAGVGFGCGHRGQYGRRRIGREGPRRSGSRRREKESSSTRFVLVFLRTFYRGVRIPLTYALVREYATSTAKQLGRRDATQARCSSPWRLITPY